MIDTVKFQIPLELTPIMGLVQQGFTERSKTEKIGKDDEFTSKYYHRSLYLGEFMYSVRINIPKQIDKSCMYVEFSLPKYVFGHNVFLFPPSLLVPVMKRIKRQIEDTSDFELPSIDEWVLQRIDICYTWKLASQYQAKQILELLKIYDFPRKDKVMRKTGLQYPGWIYKLLFYLKHDEFKGSKDYKRISKFDQGYANSLLELSKGTLRIELQVLKKKINHIFQGGSLIEMVASTEKLEGVLRDHIFKLIGAKEIRVNNSFEIMEKLKEKFNMKTSLRLFQFFTSYLESERSKAVLREHYTQSTISRNLKDISGAGISLMSDTVDFEDILSIPSNHVVNIPDKVTALAATERLEPNDRVINELCGLLNYEG